MIAIKTAKNRYKFVNIDGLKIKAFNASVAALALYGLLAVITK